MARIGTNTRSPKDNGKVEHRLTLALGLQLMLTCCPCAQFLSACIAGLMTSIASMHVPASTLHVDFCPGFGPGALFAYIIGTTTQTRLLPEPRTASFQVFGSADTARKKITSRNR